MVIEKEIFKIFKKHLVKQEVALIEDGMGDAAMEHDVRVAKSWRQLQKIYGKKYILDMLKEALDDYGT